MQFPGKLSEPIIENYLKLSLLACICVIAFCFNSTIYITLPVHERELLIKKVLHGMGLRVLPYWFGTFCFDIIIYGILVIFYFLISLSFKLECVIDNSLPTLLIFSTFGFCYLTYSYLCGFLFKTVDRALKLFAIFNFFVIFCIPLMIDTMLTLVY